jgi:hypothetical protein
MRWIIAVSFCGVLLLPGCSSPSAGPTTHCGACASQDGTTSTTLPSPLALGTTAALSYSQGTGSDVTTVSGQFIVTRVWTNATPQYVDRTNTPGETTLSQFIKLDWIGVELTIRNTGNHWFGLGMAQGSDAPALWFVVNGHGPSVQGTEGIQETNNSDLAQLSGFDIGVPNCPFPFPPDLQLNPNDSVSGCVALAVPAGVKVVTIGFNLSPGFAQHVAQWRV